MNKTLLIGVSILAVVLLVLGSLSNVVGYQSVKSTVIDSPLFQTRTQRATNLQQNSIITKYLGMGFVNQLQFSIRDNTTESLIQAIKIIHQMDKKTFTRFTEWCIHKIRIDSTIGKTNPMETLQSLYLVKAEPQLIINFFTEKDNQDITSGVIQSMCHDWFPGCITISILRYIYELIVVMFSIIYFKFISYCSDTYAPCGDRSKLHYILGEEL